MRGLLFPHRLLTNRYAYIAGLHQDVDYALWALDQWLADLRPDDIDYYQHKLVCIASQRFPEKMGNHSLAGYFQNIKRQSQIRAKINEVTLAKLLVNDPIKQIKIVALGEASEILNRVIEEPFTFDAIEWAVAKNDFQNLIGVLCALGFQIILPPQNLELRNAKIVSLKNKTNTHIRLSGHSKLPMSQRIISGRSNYCQMTENGYWRFMQSRKASLNIRGDQAVFDFQIKKQSKRRGAGKMFFHRLSPASQLEELRAEILGF